MDTLSQSLPAFLAAQSAFVLLGFVFLRRERLAALSYWLLAQSVLALSALLAGLAAEGKGGQAAWVAVACSLLVAAHFLLFAAAALATSGLRAVLFLPVFAGFACTLLGLVAGWSTPWLLAPALLFVAGAFCYLGWATRAAARPGRVPWNRLAGALAVGEGLLLASIHALPVHATLAGPLFLGVHGGAALGWLLALAATRDRSLGEPAPGRKTDLHQELFWRAPAALLLCDPDGTLLSANRATAGILEETPESIVGRALADYATDEEKEGIYALLGSLAARESAAVTRTAWLAKQNGATFLARLSAVLVEQPGYRAAALIQLEDVSHTMMANKQIREYALSLEERISAHARQLFDKNKELAIKNRELMEINKGKNVFFANVSHELRTPLVAVCGYVEMLLEKKLGPTTPRMEEAFQVASRNLGRLTQFIDNLLDLARIEAFKDKINPQPLELKRAVDLALLQFREPARARGIVLENLVPADLPPVLVDQRHVEQVLFNLLSNALKFTERGFVRVNARELMVGQVQIEVEDSGPGIPDRDKAYIFNRFYQVERGSSTREKGTGLGLAIVKELVGTYGGKVGVRDGADGGSIFHFTLSSPQTEQKRRELTHRVLVISSNRQQNSRVRRFLGARGFQVFSALTGLRALEILGAQEFDLIVTDILLPDLDGAEICKMIKNRKERYQVPVYVTTFPLGEEDRNALTLSGAKGFITKPFDERALERIIGEELAPPAPERPTRADEDR